MMNQDQNDIYLHIDRLILDGIDLPAGGGAAVQAALAGELSRLLAEGGLAGALAGGGAFDAAPASPIHLGEPAAPAALGRQIARSVYGGIGA
jgi:hypothetical protein